MRDDQFEIKKFGIAHVPGSLGIDAISAARERLEGESALKIAELVGWKALEEEANHALLSNECLRDAVALAVVDVDHFRYVNSAYGRAIGDETLHLMGLRLARNLPARAKLAKMSGDEFVILFRGFDDEFSLSAMVDNLLGVARRPITTAGNSISLSVSLGLARCPSEGRCFSELLGHAEAALAVAKSAGRNTWRSANLAHSASMRNRLRLENDLRHAIDANKLRMHYQPIVQLATGKIAGAEGLARWQSPDGQSVPPTLFIAVAEESGLIEPLGEWVLREACRQAQQWGYEGKVATRISVNVSALQLYRGVLEQHVARALDESGLPADLLELELTESVILHDIDVASSVVRRIRDMGIRVSIDDFGTGYANLSYLTKLPVDAIKIDKSFIQKILCNPDLARIVTSIAALAHSLGLTCVAEGIEEEAQAKLLELLNCDYGQGYYFGLPVPAAQFAFVLESRR